MEKGKNLKFEQLLTSDKGLDLFAYEKPMTFPDGVNHLEGKTPTGFIRMVSFSETDGESILIDAQLSERFKSQLARSLADNEKILKMFETAILIAKGIQKGIPVELLEMLRDLDESINKNPFFTDDDESGSNSKN